MAGYQEKPEVSGFWALFIPVQEIEDKRLRKGAVALAAVSTFRIRGADDGLVAVTGF